LALHVGEDAEVTLANRTRLAERARVADVVFMRQCHSAEVAVVDEPPDEDVINVDGLVVTTPGVAVAALAADCVTIALLDPEAGVVSAVHSGWVGLVDDVVGSALETMETRGAELSRVRAVLGPAICGRCYAVPSERAERVARLWPEALATCHDGQPGIDIRAGLTQRLRQAGVHTEAVGGCTFEDPALYSFRRDPVTGRHGVAVWWTQTP
jgi:YfiH family protein